MPQTKFGDVLRFLYKACGVQGACDRPDREFLERFLASRDESAFTFLVQRHGPMVIGVSRRVLGDSHEIEDVFQATFLVLAQRARTIRRRESIGSWLHGVAQRIALKERSRGACRRRREGEAVKMRSKRSTDDQTCLELRSVLDEAIGSLAEKHRAPIVLCYLEGMTHDRAARELGCPKTSLESRLIRARELLRQGLERRGITLTSAALAASLGEAASAAPVPALMAMHTVKAACLAAVSKAALTTHLSARALTLAQEALAGIVWGKRTLALVIMTLGLAMSSAVVVGSNGWRETLRQSEAREPTVASRKSQAAAAGEKTIASRIDSYGDQLPHGAVSRLGTVRFNHGHRLNSLFFLPDGKTLLSEGGGNVRLWEVTSGKELRQFSIGEFSFDDPAALSADGKFLTVLSQAAPKDSARVWDLAQGKEVNATTFPVLRRVSGIYWRNALSPDGQLCAINTPKQIHVFEVPTGKELFTIPNNEWDKSLVEGFAGSDRLVTADMQGLIQVRDARSGKLLHEFNQGVPVDRLALVTSADGSRLATYAEARSMEKLNTELAQLWDLTTGTRLHVLRGERKVWCSNVRFSPDGKFVFVRSYELERGGELTMWDVATGKPVRTLGDGPALAVSPDGRKVAMGGPKFNLVDVGTGRPASLEESRRAWAEAAFFSSSGDRAFTIGFRAISEWDAATGRHLRSTELPYVASSLPRPDHSADGRYALAFEGDYKGGHLVIWDIKAGQRLHKLAPPGANYGIKTAFSSDSALLATYQPEGDEKGIVRIWDVPTGKEKLSFSTTKADWSATPFFTPSGTSLTLAGRDVVGFDLATGKEQFAWRMKPNVSGSEKKTTTETTTTKVAKGSSPVRQPDPSAWRTLAISPDGRVAGGILPGGYSKRDRTPNRIILCNARTGKVLHRIDDSGIATPGYEPVTFSPDSRFFATADGDMIHLWEVASGKQICSLSGHRGDVSSLAFSANGRRLVSSSYDSTCLVWDLALAVGVAEPLAGTPAEKEIAAWWADLAGDDPRRAYAAVLRMAEAPKESIPLLSRRVSPVTEDQVKQIPALVADLGSETFAVRQKAFQQLHWLGPLGEPALRRSLENNPPLEVRLRLDQLLGSLASGPASGEPLRMVRMLAALEYAGTPEARSLVHTLAQGAQGAWLTDHAAAVEERARLK
jgi:RNA polymerase sigma factor (sigma-70 family)